MAALRPFRPRSRTEYGIRFDRSDRPLNAAPTRRNATSSTSLARFGAFALVCLQFHGFVANPF